MKTKDAIKYFGSAVKLAEALRIKKQAVSNWGEYPPEGRQYQIERITNSALKIEPELETMSTHPTGNP